MGQKVHPTGFRLGVIKKHNALWYARENLIERTLLKISR